MPSSSPSSSSSSKKRSSSEITSPSPSNKVHQKSQKVKTQKASTSTRGDITLEGLANPSAEICDTCARRPFCDGLYRAISENHEECFHHLLHNATNGGTETCPAMVDGATMWKIRPICYACSYNRLWCVKSLVAAGSSPFGDEKDSPLSWSCGSAGVARFLLKCGVKASEEVSNSSRDCPTVLIRAREEKSRGAAYKAWANVIEKAAREELS